MPSDIEIKSELYLGPPSDELLTWARKNINEDPNTKCQKLDEFRDLIYARGECTPHRVDDAFLLKFLRSRKFNLEAAHTLLVNYYDCREDNHYVDGVGFEALDKVGVNDLISVPPYKDQDGKRILLYKLGNWTPETVSVDDILIASWFILELAILEEQSQIMGGICIVDCAGITMQHALHMNHSIAYKIFQLAVTSHPMRLQAMHIINYSWIFETFFSLFRSLLHDKMKARLYFHNNLESLHKHVDPKSLQQAYGGIQPVYSHKLWIDGFLKDKEVIKELQMQNYSVP